MNCDGKKLTIRKRIRSHPETDVKLKVIPGLQRESGFGKAFTRSGIEKTTPDLRLVFRNPHGFAAAGNHVNNPFCDISYPVGAAFQVMSHPY
jgi:hypothetical protein